jgi:hypothetical protein
MSLPSVSMSFFVKLSTTTKQKKIEQPRRTFGQHVIIDA